MICSSSLLRKGEAELTDNPHQSESHDGAERCQHYHYAGMSIGQDVHQLIRSDQKFHIDIHDAQRLNPRDYSEPLLFRKRHHEADLCGFVKKYFNSYWTDAMK